jgi:hypothetical protein
MFRVFNIVLLAFIICQSIEASVANIGVSNGKTESVYFATSNCASMHCSRKKFVASTAALLYSLLVDATTTATAATAATAATGTTVTAIVVATGVYATYCGFS